MISKLQTVSRTSFYLVLFSLLYGAFMLALDPRPFSQLHSTSPYHRLQADALLQGHFYLSDSIEGIRHGLAWHDGKVQQVWGLGVAVWLLPFQAMTRLVGGTAFPERIALGIAFALLAFFAGTTGLKLVREQKQVFGLGLFWLVILCPALWTLARNSELVFEETVLYAVIVSLGILVSLVRIVFFGANSDYWLCYALSSFAVWVRPTHAVCGATAIIIASALLWKKNGKVGMAGGGMLLFSCSAALLAWTNNVRFGSPTEFGHKLTLSSESMIYLTRFGNPPRQQNLWVDSGSGRRPSV